MCILPGFGAYHNNVFMKPVVDVHAFRRARLQPRGIRITCFQSHHKRTLNRSRLLHGGRDLGCCKESRRIYGREPSPRRLKEKVATLEDAAVPKLLVEVMEKRRLQSGLDAAKMETAKLMAKLEEASKKEADLQRQKILLKETNARLRSQHAKLCTKNAELVIENANIMHANANLYRMNYELQQAQSSGDVGDTIKI